MRHLLNHTTCLGKFLCEHKPYFNDLFGVGVVGVRVGIVYVGVGIGIGIGVKVGVDRAKPFFKLYMLYLTWSTASHALNFLPQSAWPRVAGPTKANFLGSQETDKVRSTPCRQDRPMRLTRAWLPSWELQAPRSADPTRNAGFEPTILDGRNTEPWQWSVQECRV